MWKRVRAIIVSSVRLAMFVIVYFVCQSAGFWLADHLQKDYYDAHNIDSMGGGLGGTIAWLMLLCGPYYGAWVFVAALSGLAAIDLMGSKSTLWSHTS